MLPHTIFVTILFTFFMHVHAILPVRVLTHNVRYATTSPGTGEKPWAQRAPLIINELKYNTLYNNESFICLQEVLNGQLTDVMTGLGSEWSYIGVGRDDGKKKGEYSPIIFRNSTWELESWRTVWLNEDGSVGKKGWDAGSVRIVTIGHFKHIGCSKRVIGMCTHFDNSGVVSRRESAKIVLKLVDSERANPTAGEPLPVFLAGDLNSETSDEAYQLLNASTSPLQDTKELAKWKYGNTWTFTGFREKSFSLIDFVFVDRGGNNWATEGYSVLPNKFDDAVYSSDHRAVVVDAVLTV